MDQEEVINCIKDMICNASSELKNDVINSLMDSRIARFSNLYPSITTVIPKQLLLELSFAETTLSPISFNAEETVVLTDKLRNRYKFYPYYESQCLPCSFTKEVIDNKQLKITLQGLHDFFYLDKEFIDVWINDKSVFDSNSYYQKFTNATFQLKLYTNEGELNKSLRLKALQNNTFLPDFGLKNKINNPNLFTALRLEFTNDISQLQIHKAEILITLPNNEKISPALLKSLYFNCLAIVNCTEDFASNIVLDSYREQYPLLNETDDNLCFHSIKEVHVKFQDGTIQPVFHKLVSNNEELSYEIKNPSVANKLKHAHIFLHNFDPMLHHQLMVSANWYDADVPEEFTSINFIQQPNNLFNSVIARQFPIVKKQESSLRLINQITDILHKSTLSHGETLQVINLLTENKYDHLAINDINKITNIRETNMSANESKFYKTIFAYCEEYISQLKL